MRLKVSMATKHFVWLMVFVGCVIVLPSCWKSTVTTEQKQQGLIVVNVLDKALYDDCHIKGSVHVTFDKLDTFATGLDK